MLMKNKYCRLPWIKKKFVLLLTHNHISASHTMTSVVLFCQDLVRCLLTMKTSNSSRHRKGDSMASQRARMKQIVENERSPPDRALMSLEHSFFWTFGCTYKKHSQLSTSIQRFPVLKLHFNCSTKIYKS